MLSRLSSAEARKILSTRSHKYNAQKTVIDNITFASRKEAEYYLYFKKLLEKGEIKELKLQPKFVLQEGFCHNNKKYRAITYTADFYLVHKDGTVEVVDIKGKKTQVYQLKKKLFLFKYPDVVFTEI